MFEVTGLEASGAHEDTGHPQRLSRCNVGSEAITDHGDTLGWEAKAGNSGTEEVGGRLADEKGLTAGSSFQSHQEGAGVECWSVAAFPDEVTVHGHEVCTAEEETKSKVQAVVRVDAAGAAEDDDGGTLVLDHGEARELLTYVTFDEEEAPLVRIVGAEVGSCGITSSDDLIVAHWKVECAEEFPQLASGTDSGVGEEHVGNTEGAEALQRLSCTGEGIAVDMEDTVDVDQQSLDRLGSAFGHCGLSAPLDRFTPCSLHEG